MSLKPVDIEMLTRYSVQKYTSGVPGLTGLEAYTIFIKNRKTKL